MTTVQFKTRIKRMNERLLRLQLPELCVDAGPGTYDGVLDCSKPRHSRPRRIAAKMTRIKLAALELRGVLETLAKITRDFEAEAPQ